ncbi:hypothetical protein NHH03_14485 [Stieleria sp. TO1_6]|uniref:hypothetical protein n=1 Tax=Stieleria tagensis TaxID=2956795 RepID=UPI00209B31F8|nr:hypothetical protein [Stieleria tagensis]MCO8122953.1 hypothetical protein [Stieleria tagensis]
MSDLDQQLPAGWKIWSDDSATPQTEADASDPRWMRELDLIAGTGPNKTRSVPLKLLVPLLLSAQQRNSTWLSDFADDTVVIDADLHDVLLAYGNLRLANNGDSAAGTASRAAA